MRNRIKVLCHLRRVPPILFLCLCAHLSSQPLSSQKKEQSGQIFRVNVGLVQTDVMVFDRQGRFVPDLRLEQFELRVDGKVQPLAFLELVSAGSAHDEEIWAMEAARAAPAPAQPSAPAPAPVLPSAPDSNPGRTLLYFVDDWHLAADNTMRAKAALENLIHTSMGPRDRVAILAASGQLGMEQTLTGDKSALIATLQKLSFKSPGVQDQAWPPMTEGQALLIEQDDWNAITYFVQGILGKAVVKTTRGWELPGDRSGSLGRDCNDAEKATRRRAADLAQISAAIGERTLSALRTLLQSFETLPGRKLVFFLSDGFVLQTQKSDIVSRITDLTSRAARAGIVIYSLDTRGLVVGLPDAKVKRGPDMTGALAASGYSETMAGQDALNALAADTGGRFLKNTNALDTALITALAEMSRYYLLGWHIDTGKLNPEKASAIRVAVKGRSDLRVRVREGKLDLTQLVSRPPEAR